MSTSRTSEMHYTLGKDNWYVCSWCGTATPVPEIDLNIRFESQTHLQSRIASNAMTTIESMLLPNQHYKARYDLMRRYIIQPICANCRYNYGGIVVPKKFVKACRLLVKLGAYATDVYEKNPDLSNRPDCIIAIRQGIPDVVVSLLRDFFIVNFTDSSMELYSRDPDESFDDAAEKCFDAIARGDLHPELYTYIELMQKFGAIKEWKNVADYVGGMADDLYTKYGIYQEHLAEAMKSARFVSSEMEPKSDEILPESDLDTMSGVTIPIDKVGGNNEHHS